ncbi:M48 family metallopeptidase [Bifidobacterium gallicum]|uniref:Metal-dependent hydrolase n=1 Tax=Bifidobacterium gallicum DSM 20093 = LMG 11596 TaxID=561180 RepID=D1NWB5_9BIFI|nr:SprT family zinc-dependent metalloprotease [Bifidobacterium gallicum]EFA22401.1 hypothetical protein BIFGAL_04162 [Bifidobacterium gallicum DSM 20093 = LMG 11596]KFI60098.1 metal-dependent hydrolase [Bifidobacterium gallicum DSM 20093 = LMG 11596]
MPFNSLPRARAGSRAKRVAARSNTPISRETKVIDGIQVSVLRKHNRNMYLRVKPPYGQVEVTAPMRVTINDIERFVRERHCWIIKAQHTMAQARSRTLRGQGNGNATEGTTEIQKMFRWNDERIEQARAEIERRLPELLERWSVIVGRKPTAVTLRIMKSRWGSCTPRTGRIRLNLQLGLMEPQFLEYVLVHEMVHLWESGHGEGFQRRMTAALPNWKQLRREINQRAVLEGPQPQD